MRHLHTGRKFGRVRKVRKGFIKSLVVAVIMNERIETTEARAKELRLKVEPLITRARKGTLADRRLVAKALTVESTKKLFDVIAPRYKDRTGGYSRVIKLGIRKSDAAPMAIFELVK